MKKILLLGSTGKMGTAITKVFTDYEIIGKNSKDFEAADPESVRKIIKENPVDIVINTVAMLGIDNCEVDQLRANVVNSYYPRTLAKLSVEFGFKLVHFSTDAVFDGEKQDYYTELDKVNPINYYGLSKHRGDYAIQYIDYKYYIFRIPLLFGPTTKTNQFVEKMLTKEGTIKVANDIICSPSYSIDIAKRIEWIIRRRFPFGLYHIANEGKASLYELMQEIAPDKIIEPCSYKDFPHIGVKNTYTPIESHIFTSLRNWKEAVKECYGR
jgi:dTDP-4-dehydrorhamnose reductase